MAKNRKLVNKIGQEFRERILGLLFGIGSAIALYYLWQLIPFSKDFDFFGTIGVMFIVLILFAWSIITLTLLIVPFTDSGFNE